MRRPLAPLAASLAALLAFCLGCGSATPEKQVDAAQAALNGGKYGQAVDAADASLKDPAVASDPSRRWRLTKIRIEALGAQGKEAEVVAALASARQAFPDKTTAELYAEMGGKTLRAGHPVPALMIAEEGRKAFPEQQALFDKLVEQLEAASKEDPELRNKLKDLGYV